jgi:hypothetical protein
MMYTPILALHICAGTVGLLSGALAMAFRKGSRRHAIAGKVFVISMLCLGASAMVLAIMKHEIGNFVGGILTIYLVTTAWLTARRRDGETGIFDWAAILIPLGVGISSLALGIQKLTNPAASSDGVPAGMNFFMGTVVLLAAAGDVRMILRGISRTQRIARHLWRMCFGLFIAAGSFFMGPSNRPLRLLTAAGLGQHLSPALFSTGVYLTLTLLPLILLVYWLVRVRFTNFYRGKSIQVATASPD